MRKIYNDPSQMSGKVICFFFIFDIAVLAALILLVRAAVWPVCAQEGCTRKSQLSSAYCRAHEIENSYYYKEAMESYEKRHSGTTGAAAGSSSGSSSGTSNSGSSSGSSSASSGGTSNSGTSSRKASSYDKDDYDSPEDYADDTYGDDYDDWDDAYDSWEDEE